MEEGQMDSLEHRQTGRQADRRTDGQTGQPLNRLSCRLAVMDDFLLAEEEECVSIPPLVSFFSF